MMVHQLSLSLAFLLLSVLARGATAQSILVPAFTGYPSPDPRTLSRREDGSVDGWNGVLRFYVDLKRTGTIKIALEGVRVSSRTNLAITFGAQPEGEGASRCVTLDVGEASGAGVEFEAREIGYHRISLRADSAARIGFAALRLEGDALEGARCGRVERRNAASVHLGYEVPQDVRDEVAWFYVEMTPRTDPLWSYYMATGWHRGYFGMQVNSPTERRLIFSVWDSGDEAIDRSRVSVEDRVALLAKGEKVHASGFGNEGTGGHSHLVYPWSLGDRFRFLVHARPEGDATVYSGWFWFSEAGRWDLIASFRAPKDGRFLRGLYSFNENFAGDNGDRERLCEFGNAWVRGGDGEWHPITSARFTHDGHGDSERLDRSAGVIGDRWYLRNGGFDDDPRQDAVTVARERLSRDRGHGRPPTDEEIRAMELRARELHGK